MSSSITSAVKQFIKQESLPAEYAETVQKYFIPLTETILHKLSMSNETLVVGISGCQGSGKSTLASLLVVLLREMMGVKAINLSIDDFYLSHAQRQRLGNTIHPLLATRGVPGTHDVELAIKIINGLKEEGEIAVPRFNKAVDDRFPEQEWVKTQGPVDVIILEGWCLSIGPEKEAALNSSVNELEELEDTQGKWRSYVNNQLHKIYPPLYNLLDYLIMLKAPSFEKVFEWRQIQEDKLSAKHKGKDNKVMNKSELKRFIQHYERLTRHGLKALPEQADIVFRLSNKQTIEGKA